jgi:hypothetical protein
MLTLRVSTQTCGIHKELYEFCSSLSRYLLNKFNALVNPNFWPPLLILRGITGLCYHRVCEIFRLKTGVRCSKNFLDSFPLLQLLEEFLITKSLLSPDISTGVYKGRPRWSSGQRACHWTQGSRVKTRWIVRVIKSAARLSSEGK